MSASSTSPIMRSSSSSSKTSPRSSTPSWMLFSRGNTTKVGKQTQRRFSSYCFRSLAMCASLCSILWITSSLTSLVALSSTSSTSPSPSSSYTSWFGLGLLVSASATTMQQQQQDEEESTTQQQQLLTLEQLQELVQNMRGDDTRLMRWDSTIYTRQQQQNNGGCNSIHSAIELLLATTTSTSSSTRTTTAKATIAIDSPPKLETADDKETTDIATRQALACEYLTLCVTDHAEHRRQASQYGKPLYQAIVQLISSNNPNVSAKASHVVYSISFANKNNHWGLYQSNAITALAQVILRFNNNGTTTTSDASTFDNNISPRPDQVMWACAGLQNMVASYCATNNDGRCYWQWGFVPGSIGHELHITGDSLPVVSEGTSMRLVALQHHPTLVSHLSKLVCQYGPVHGIMSDTNPYPGDNAQIDHHETSTNVIAWAAAGAIKNLALDPLGRSQIREVQQELLPCLCQLSHVSPDWLEQNKGNGALHHLRFSDPCWFTEPPATTSRSETQSDAVQSSVGAEEDSPRELWCIDDIFQDESGYHCGDYVHPRGDECTRVDVLERNWTSKQACCTCGGGLRLKEPNNDMTTKTA